MLEPAVRRDQAEIEAGEVAVGVDLVAELLAGLTQQHQCVLDNVERFGQGAANLVATACVQRFAHAAGHGPGRVYASSAQDADRLLAELAQADAVAGDVRMFLDQAGNIAQRRVAVHAEQEVRAAEVEEAQGVTLDDLAPVHQPAQLCRGGRNVDAEDGVTCLGRRQQVADRADAANAGGDAGHFPEGAAFAELLEAAKFGDVEAGVLDLAAVVQHDRDLGMALNSGYGIDYNRLRHRRLHLSGVKNAAQPSLDRFRIAVAGPSGISRTSAFRVQVPGVRR